jgi:hypothetical protein
MIIKSMKIEKTMRTDVLFDPNAPDKYNCVYSLLVETDGEAQQAAVYVDDPMRPEHAAKVLRAFAQAVEGLERQDDAA